MHNRTERNWPLEYWNQVILNNFYLHPYQEYEDQDEISNAFLIINKHD